MIRPEFWSSIKISKLSQGARLTFIGIWSFADDYGVILANVNQIHSNIFPWDSEITRETVESYLRELLEGGFLHEISYEGKPFYCVNEWRTQQKVDKPSKRCWIKGGHKEIAEIIEKTPITKHSRNTRETFPAVSKKNLDEREQEQEQEQERERVEPRVFSGDEFYNGDFSGFEYAYSQNSNFVIAKFKIREFWDHWASMGWVDSNGKRIDLRQKCAWAFKDFKETGKSAYFGEERKMTVAERQAHDKKVREEGGPFNEDIVILPTNSIGYEL